MRVASVLWATPVDDVKTYQLLLRRRVADCNVGTY